MNKSVTTFSNQLHRLVIFRWEGNEISWNVPDVLQTLQGSAFEILVTDESRIVATAQVVLNKMKLIT